MRNELDRWLTRHPLPEKASSTKEERAEYFSSMPAAVKREWELRKAKRGCDNDPNHNSAIAERARKRLARVDAMPPDLRLVVYEYGLEIVQEFLNCGIKIPKTIRHLIDTVRHADYESGQARFKINKGPNAKRNPAEEDDEYYVAARAS